MKQTQALDILKTGQNVFLTGSAGSGKTYVLNQYIQYLRQKNVNVSVTATTGIAATHLNGLTIHSWSGLGIKDTLTKKDFESLLKKRHLRKNILNADVLIIDEISMLHAHQLDLVNQICQAFRKSLEPFGGLQIIMSGDFFQLPPISKNGELAKMVTESNIWPQMNLQVCYLDEQFRQEDPAFINLLNEIRQNKFSQDSQQLLLDCTCQEFDLSIEPTKLYTHNVDVDAINYRELMKISSPAKAYQMQLSGNQTLAEILQKGCLAPDRLMLKIGAKVMFVKNNFEAGVVNGTVGEVVDFDEDSLPIVKTSKGELIVAKPADWLIEEDERIIAQIKQIPLRLAWAITVHKSQGLSLDLAEIDLSKAFTPGMGYVALSRVRSLSGLRLLGLNQMALKVDEKVLALDKNFIDLSVQIENNWQKLSSEEKDEKQKKFNSGLPNKPKKNKNNSNQNKEKTKKFLVQKKSLLEIAQELNLTTGTILKYTEEIMSHKPALDFTYLLPEEKELQEITLAFENCGLELLRPVFDFCQEKYSYDALRLVRAWLKAK
ncbi:MAG TPA: AAA family ATPase [bacterium]|nr:AAA family ATPase [bacterium]